MSSISYRNLNSPASFSSRPTKPISDQQLLVESSRHGDLFEATMYAAQARLCVERHRRRNPSAAYATQLRALSHRFFPLTLWLEGHTKSGAMRNE